MPSPVATELVGLLERLAGPLEGNTEQEVAQTERRLGGRLPTALREIYLRAGRMVRLWDARGRGCWHLRGLGGLRVDGMLLVFATEQQGSWEWGVEVGDGADPVVLEGVAHEWKATAESLTTFLRGVVLLHTSSCTLDWEGGAEVSRDLAERALQGWEHVPFRPQCGNFDFYMRDAVVVRCDWSAASAVIFAGGANEAQVRELAGRLGLLLPAPWPNDA